MTSEFLLLFYRDTQIHKDPMVFLVYLAIEIESITLPHFVTALRQPNAKDPLYGLINILDLAIEWIYGPSAAFEEGGQNLHARKPPINAKSPRERAFQCTGRPEDQPAAFVA